MNYLTETVLTMNGSWSTRNMPYARLNCVYRHTNGAGIVV